MMMILRTILAILGLAGLGFGIWVLIPRSQDQSEWTWLQRLLHVFHELDLVMSGFAWMGWMGVFGGLLRFGLTGAGIFV